MSRKTKFKDALDYIFIANDSGSGSYLISSSNNNEIVATTANRVTNAINATAAASVATATAAAIMSDAVNAADVSSATDVSGMAALVAENLFSSVAVGLGAMLINDTLFTDINDNGTEATNFFNEIVNGSDLMATANGTSTNATNTHDDLGELLKMAATSVILGLMILVTIIGNVFVIAAIILERNLQNVANYLVASLAVADLFVACLVMPLGAVYEISEGWILGPELCDIWTSCDVLCCTASILHLVAIAVDRYWAVTNIDYMHSRTSRRIFLMIFCVWSAAVIVSLAPQFGWKDPDYLQRIEQQKCMVSQDVAYQVFATCCTFYVPLLVILVLYWKIYQTARKRIHRRRPRPIDVTGNNNQPDLSAHKKRKRLRLRIGKFSGEKGGTAGTTLGLVEGNSTNTVNTVEDTEFSSSNVDSKSRAGIEVTTVFTSSSNPEEIATTSTSQISTVSHLVALANQQHATTTPKSQSQLSENAHSVTAATTIDDKLAASTATTTTPAASTNRVSIVLPNDNNDTATIISSGTIPTTTTTIAIVNGGAGGGCTEVLEDPQLQQQLQQVQQHADAAATKTGSSGAGGATTSNATTITSISALSPQTPTTPTAPTLSVSHSHLGAAAAASSSSAQMHPLTSSSPNASCQVTPIPKPKHQQLSSISNPMHKVTKRKETLEAKRERKAAKTLAIITGAFVVCWLPFFLMALLLPLCAVCKMNDSVASLFLWLGYFNSTLNPVIYTIFSPEFRQAFKRILFGGHRPVHYRSGKL